MGPPLPEEIAGGHMRALKTFDSGALGKSRTREAAKNS